MATKRWKLFWTKDALKDLDAINYSDSELIKQKVSQYLLQDPIHIGKPLKHVHKGTYSYRIGLYRVLYSIDREHVLVLVIKVGKRDQVYKLHEDEVIYFFSRVQTEKAAENYSAYSPDLPGCVATGKTPEEVERNMIEAIKMHIEGLKKDFDIRSYSANSRQKEE